jgi:hypothetical protein
MADESESTVTAVSRDGGDSLLEKITEKLHFDDSSSDSSDSHSEADKPVVESVKEKVFRLFGREKPVHSVLGGGKRMNLFLYDVYLLFW